MKRCVCRREATHVRWGSSPKVEAGRGIDVTYHSDRIPACAFHAVHPDHPHPFDATPEEPTR